MNLAEINKICQNTLIGHLGIEFTSFKNETLEARMKVDERTIQPMGYLHGGASLALAETVGSGASLLLTNPNEYNVFGMNVSANHIASVRQGYVHAKATIIHKGRTSHVWDIEIKDDSGKLISVARVTNAIVLKKEK
ncbi:MAG TPA: hotdog fold thioesterase [Prolixibacteraceae bacterium]|nr:hotdog fold thioesterase [Prolixibacteraceae bacterium]